MDDLFCHSCQRNYPASSHPAVFNDDNERICPSCRGEFIELVPQPAPQQPPAVVGSGFPRLQGSLEVHLAASVVPSSMPVGTMVFQVSNGVLTPLSGLTQGPGMPFSLGDFGLGESLDQIVARIADLHQPPIIPTSQSVVDSLPRQRPRPEHATEKDGFASCKVGESCTVCHEEYQEDTTVLELPCQHCFHEECILPWLREHNTCPVCRFKLQEGSPLSRHHSSRERERQPEQQQQQAERQSTQDSSSTATDTAAAGEVSVSRPATLPATVQDLSETQAHITQLEEILVQQLNEHATLQQEMQALQEQRDRLHQQYQQLTEAGQQATIRLADILNRRPSAPVSTDASASDSHTGEEPVTESTDGQDPSPWTVRAETEDVQAGVSAAVPAEAGVGSGVAGMVDAETPGVSGIRTHDQETPGVSGIRTDDQEAPEGLGLLSPSVSPPAQRSSILANVVAMPGTVLAVMHGVLFRPVVELANIAGRGVRRFLQI